MTYDEFATLAVGILVVLVLLFALRFWRRAVTEMTRQRLFAVRAELFDAAAMQNKFEDSAYRETRLVINGVLRDLDRINGWVWLYYGFMHWKSEDTELLSSALPSVEMQDSVIKTRKSVSRILSLHLWVSSIDTFAAMLIFTILGHVNIIIQAALHEAERVGRDDSYALITINKRPCYA